MTLSKYIVGFILLIYLNFTQAIQLTTHSQELTQNDIFNLTLKTDSVLVGDIYLGIQALPNGTFYFVNSQLVLEDAAVQFRQAQVIESNLLLLSIPARLIPIGKYRWFTVVVAVGKSPYDTTQWLAQGLQSLDLDILPSTDDICIPPERWHAEMGHCMIF